MWKYDNPDPSCAYPRHSEMDKVDYCWSFATAIDNREFDNFDANSRRHWMMKKRVNKYKNGKEQKGFCRGCDQFWPWHKRAIASAVRLVRLRASADFGLYYVGKPIPDYKGRMFRPARPVKPAWLRWMFASKGTRKFLKISKKHWEEIKQESVS